jgi:putative phosphatase
LVKAMRPADFCAESIFEVDFAALAAVGVRGILLDVDNTLVAPGSDRIAQTLVEHLRRERESTGIAHWALASNARRDLSPIASAMEAEVVQAEWLSAKPRRMFYRRALAKLGLQPPEVAMIGDRALHDAVPAARLGLRTVLVRPQWPDQLVDRLLLRRCRESRAAWVREAWSSAAASRSNGLR